MGGGPRKCPVQSCDFRSSKGFYNIPEHPVRRQAWVEACKLVLPYNKPICYRHFNMSDFLKEITDEDINQLKFGSLKKNVVPSQNLPDDSEINLEPSVKAKSSIKPLIARICPVESCDYRSTKGYYAVPEDPERRQAWIEACKLSPQCNLNTKICFQHFKISDFLKDITEEEIAQRQFGKLNKNVVPSQNLPGDPKTDFAFFLEPNVILKESDEILKIKGEPCEFNISGVNEGEIPSNQNLGENNWRDKVIKVEPSENDIIAVGIPSNDCENKGLKRGPCDPNDWRVESKPSKNENCEMRDDDEKREMKQVYEQHGGYVIVNQECNGKRQRIFHDCTFYGFPHQSLHENYTYKNCKFYLE